MRISDWSSDVCSSDLTAVTHSLRRRTFGRRFVEAGGGGGGSRGGGGPYPQRRIARPGVPTGWWRQARRAAMRGLARTDHRNKPGPAAKHAGAGHNRPMDRYERILSLHRILKTARYPVTVARLRDELACSRATVYRDLAFPRDGLMAPVVGDGAAGFRYHADERNRFELHGLCVNSGHLPATTPKAPPRLRSEGRRGGK